ncbi:MAG: hypothetical protein PHW19_13520, partial [Salinivirgaceae bacterium]|nr:hypothetical protein [Salinivirgaceae bacterium]
MMYSTLFWYDRLGRMVVSRNTKQFNKNAYSYTLYDALGRISEVGEINESESPTMKFSEVFGDYVGNVLNPNTINDSKYADWIAANARTQVTRTFYDSPIISEVDITQDNLRKRVATATYSDVWDADSTEYDHATHYSYDIHGNVKTLWQDNRALDSISGVNISQRFKRIDYDYDLVSGKVNEVRYQAEQPDQFTHRYEYDADNRIKNVKTSRDDVFFDNDASYYYYLHGPLARVELGEDKVQGIDYIYTLQGWIKGVNSNSLDAKVDPGMDGDMSGSNHNFAKDAFGYTLNYFNGDYQAINPDKTSFETNFIAHTENFDNLAHDAPNLYNGNISSMATTIVNNKEYEVLPQFTMYKYDQLNRLKSMKAFADFNFERNVWEYDGYKGRYENNFEYDANGNILSLQRNNQAGVMFDNFTYQYQKIDNKMLSNRLYHVNDDVNMNSIMTDDIDDQGDFSEKEINTINNYGYDEIGNLTRNTQKEIAEIKWTVYGKVQEVIRTQGSSKKNLKFEYNATGQRIAKHVYSSYWKPEYTDYYVYDAQGNIMSIYRLSVDEQQQTASYTLTERPIYGSGRLGVDKATLEFMGYTPPTNGLTNHVLGLKQYEGSNHLGNVLTTFSDKKIPVENNGVIDYYNADVTSSTDYYPFGVTMKGRDFNSSTSRFGFNSMEKIEETETMDFGARLLDGDLGVWLALDPLAAKYPGMSPYCFVANSPLIFVDPDGREVKAHDAASKDLVIKTMTFLFGEEHGFGFDNNNNLLHNGVMPEKMTNEQQLMFKYVVETLVESTTLTYVQVTNQDFNTYESATMIIPEYLGEKVSGRSTFIGEGKKMT